MKKLYLVCLTVLCQVAVMAQVSITSLSTPYNENFDSLTASGTLGGFIPVGWQFLESGTNANSSYAVDNGASNSGNTYSYGSTGSSERAFGTLLSGSLTSTIGAVFHNNSGSTITSITLNYYGERWRLGAANRVDSLIFQYSTNATSLTSGTYTTVNQLSYGVPGVAGTAGPLDGNAAANRTAISYTITGLSIPVGGVLYIRWNDYNASGADDGLAVDDVSIAFNGITLPPCSTPVAQPGALSFGTVTTTGFAVSFAAASPAPNEYLAVISTSPSLGAVPVNGTVYNSDDIIGNGFVTFRGSSTSFSVTGLTPGTTYYLFIFSANTNCSGGPLYLTTNPATGSQATTTQQLCNAPTTQPTSVVISSVTGNSISGSFTPATDADGYLVTITTNINLGFTPVNGTVYAVGSTVGNGTVVKFGPGNTFSATGLSPNTYYYITFFAFNHYNCTGGPAYNTSGPAVSLVPTNNNTSGIPANYYDTVTTQTNAALKTVLKWRTTSGHTPKTYGDLWTQYLVSDVKPREVGPGTSSTVIWDVYSDNPTGTDPYNFTPGPISSGGQQDNGTNVSSEGMLYNREHSVPLSWFKGNTGTPGPATDYLHIFPTDKLVNAQRSNYIYGEITSPAFTSLNGSKLGPNAFAGLTGTGFEPINEYKGDLARAFLYFVTRYEDNMAEFLTNNTSTEVHQAFEPNTYPSVDAPYLRLMIKWHQQDPVSVKEINRNNAAYTYQGNRNPYIDHPEYVCMVWSSTCSALPVHIVSFTGALQGSKVVLYWQVQNEQNLQQYVIERSENGRLFSPIGAVTAANTSGYQFSDGISQLTGRRLYYRLKKQDRDGRFSYSDVFTVHVPLNLSFSVYPNPVKNGLINVQLAKPAVANSFMQVTDITGKTYQQVRVSTGAVSISIPVKNLAPGTYLLRLTQPEGNSVVQKIQVQ